MAKKVEGYIKDSGRKGNSGTTGWSCTWTARNQYCSVYKRV